MAKTKTTTITPLGDRVLVRRLEADEKTKGGIILPDAAKEKPQIGKVVSVGDGKILKDGKRQELQVKKGDTILFSSYAGDEFKLGADKVLLMREEDVLAVLDD
jgi:chaperonin GroES